MDNSQPKEKKKRKNSLSERTSGSVLEKPFVSRSNPLADLLFSSITKEMVEAASRGELLLEQPKEVDREKDQVDQQQSKIEIDRSRKRSKKPQKIQKFSTTPANFAGVPS